MRMLDERASEEFKKLNRPQLSSEEFKKLNRPQLS